MIVVKDGIVQMSVAELAPLIKKKLVSPVELTKAALDIAEARNGQINAYISMSRSEAEQAANKAEEEIMNGNYRGMYHGIPIAIKDNIYIKNGVTTVGSKIHKDFVPGQDAVVIKKLKEAGAIFTGKLNMHEYAWGITNDNPHFGPSRNPWDLDRMTGGSSGGSGAAVAADMVFAALGTDTGGSIRIPASACGIVGLKPTYGRVSNEGSFPLASTLDHIGPMTKTVKDAAGLFEIITEKYQLEEKKGSLVEHLTDDIKDLTIGIHEAFFFSNIDSGIEKLVRQSIQRLIDMGAKVEDINIPSIKSARWAQSVILRSEFASVHRENRIMRAQDFGQDIQHQFKEDLPSVVDYLYALELRGQLRKECEEVFDRVDVIVSPTLSIMPPKIGAEYGYLDGKEVDVFEYILRLTGLANTTGLPAISVPCGLKDDMPVGLQIIGAPFDEKTVLNTAYAFEQTNPLNGRKPSFSV